MWGSQSRREERLYSGRWYQPPCWSSRATPANTGLAANIATTTAAQNSDMDFGLRCFIQEASALRKQSYRFYPSAAAGTLSADIISQVFGDATWIAVRGALYLVIANAKNSGDIRSGAVDRARVPGPAGKYDVRFAGAQAGQAACGLHRYTQVCGAGVACRAL